jgi:replicative DNA helicase
MDSVRKNKISLFDGTIGGKLPPQFIEAEECVLGAMLLDIESCDFVINMLSPDCFYKNEHQKIYSAITELVDQKKKVDIITATAQLRKKGELDSVGGPFYIATLTNRVVSSANIEEHTALIYQCFMKREVIRLGNDMIIKGYDEGEDVFDIHSDTQRSLDNLINFRSINMPIGLVDLDKSLRERNEKLLSSKGISGIPSGLTLLDIITGGWQKTDLIILAARPGMGKTSLALKYAVTALKMGFGVVFFSLEMSRQQLYYRLASIETGIPLDKLMKEGLNNLEMDQYSAFQNMAKNWNVIIDDTPALAIQDMRLRVKQYKTKYQIDLILTDYLQLHTVKGFTGGNRNEEVGKISGGLKAIAKEFDVPVIALSQLSRSVETRGGTKEPMLSDLRDSGCLSGDTIIHVTSDKRRVRIKDLVHRKRFHILATDYTKNKSMRATKAWLTGEREVFKITLINGMEIKATGNHKFLSEEKGWTQLENLGVGDKIAIPFNYGQTHDSALMDSEVCILGHFIANGSAISRQPIRYTCNILDDDLSKIVMKHALNAVGNLRPSFKDTIRPKSSSRTVYFKPSFHLTHGKTSPLGDLIKKHGLWDKRAKDKFVPDQLFFASHKQTCLFLKSLFSGDGTAYYREQIGRKSLTISYSSSSRELINGIQILFSKIGIYSRISEHKNTADKKWFNLTVSGKSSIDNYVSNIGFWNKRKNDIMLKGWEKMKNISSGWTKASFNKNKTLCYVPIKSIENCGIEFVYDIEVPEVHNFTANGIIVHNSIEQDADLVQFLYRPEYYGITEDETGQSLLGVAKIIIAKHRNGAIDNAKVAFNGRTVTFSNLAAFTIPQTMPPQSNEGGSGGMKPNKDFDATNDIPF